MTAAVKKRRRSRSFERKLERTAYVFIAPAAILLIIFCIVPMLGSVYVSMQKMGVDLSKAEYVGLDNYTKALADRRFIQSIGITLRYTAIEVPLQMVIGVVLSALLAKNTLINRIMPRIGAPYIASNIGGTVPDPVNGGTVSIKDNIAPYYITEVDGVKLSSIQFLVTGLLSAVLVLIFEKPDISAILAGWKPILYLALMSSGVGYTLQIIGQKYSDSPTLASILMSMESVFAVIGGVIFMHAIPQVNEWIGCGIMLAAIIIAQLPSDLLKKKAKQF